MNFMCSLTGDVAVEKSLYFQSLEAVIHSDEYQNHVLFEDKAFILSCTKYQYYPTECFQNDEFFIYLEGKIYEQGRGTLEEQLNQLAHMMFSGKEAPNSALKKWLLSTDGEFIIFIMHKPSRRIMVIDDIFSRLPLFIHRSDGKVILSRDIRFILNQVDNIEFDRMVFAQYLLFSFPLGRHTLFKDVYQLEPASLVTIDLNNGTVNEEVVHTFNFDIKEHKNKSANENAGELARLFAESCRARGKDASGVVLSLSGGLDSRTTGAGLKYNNIPFVATSWLDSRKISQLDVNTARLVAQSLGAEWTKFELDRACGIDVLKLLRIKSGAVFVGIPHLVQYFTAIKQKYGPDITYMSGNGGDRIARDITPPWRAKNLDELVNRTVTMGRFLPQAGTLPVDEIAALTEIPKDEIIEELKRHFGGYPEKRMDQKFVHYNLYGQSMKWHNHGVDRNRFFLWSTTPFWSVHFFRYMMNCPDSQKKNKQLYLKFLSILHRPTSEVAYADNRATESQEIALNKYIIWQWLMAAYKLPNPVRFLYKQIKKLLINPSPPEYTCVHPADLIECMNEQLQNCSAISENLSRRQLKRIISHCSKYHGLFIALVFTLMSVIEDFKCGKSTIENYLDTDMDSYG